MPLLERKKHMTSADTPTHVTEPASDPAADVDIAALEADLTAVVDGEVRFDAGSRGAYSTDASNYRQVPIGVVLPRSVDAGAEAVRVCREHGAPLLSRGGGTSLAGQCCNAGVVIDWTKYCNRVVEVDAEDRRAIVETGIVLDDLNARLEPYGLMVGPRPSPHFACSIGGMLGNNACGSTAQRYGKMVDNIRRLEVLTYDGVRMWVGETGDDEYERILREGGRKAEIYRQLRALRDTYMAEIRLRYPDIPRRVSGYNIDRLLPEHDFDVARALVGSESTLVTILHAEVDLVEVPQARTLVVLGYSDIFAAADAIPDIGEHQPMALEGIDDRLFQLERDQNLAEEALQQLPEGSGWLMVQFGGQSEDEVERRAQGLIDALGLRETSPRVAYLEDPAREDQLWAAREAGLGATAYPPLGPPTHEGWEDAAVPPARLGDYLRDFRALLAKYGYASAALYGHFGHGCVHTRIPFDLSSADGIAAYRGFAEEAADLVVHYGGSLSGEHGDGQSRGELLPKMFGDDIVRAFGQMKTVFDPAGRMNPGKVVHPYRLDDKLKYGTSYHPMEPATHFWYAHDDFQFSQAANRCVGVGKCRSESGGVMCPSYRATGEEEHSTRGRARLLFEMLQGEEITDGWRSTEVRDALDLCLACKGCKSDCPVGVDMATYKAEFLSHHYARRLRPRAHYSMGWLPLWSRLAALAPGVVNAVTHAPGLDRVLKRAAGVTRQRDVPVFARQRFTDWFRERGGPRATGGLGDVVLWPDTFSNNLHPSVARAAVEVLEDAGFRVTVPTGTVCCGLTWISTGQLDVAKRVIQHAVDALRDDIRAGTPVVGLEPSCTAVFRADAPELFHGDDDVQRLANQTYTLAELLAERAPDWRPEHEVGRDAIAQTHCHQHAVMGFDADKRLAEAAGVTMDKLDVGCCGVAGNFGFEAGHYEVSVACAEQGLWQAVSEADDATFVLADGFSCRTQIEHGGFGRTPVHMAELLAAGVRGTPQPSCRPELATAERPAAPSRAAGVVVLGALAGLAGIGAAGAAAAAATGRARRR